MNNVAAELLHSSNQVWGLPVVDEDGVPVLYASAAELGFV